jgi:hypothetical protein
MLTLPGFLVQTINQRCDKVAGPGKPFGPVFCGFKLG